MLATRDPLNAFLDLPEVIVPHAQSGPLAGLSLGVKDIFDVAGYVTGCGNPHKAAKPARPSAPHSAVQMLLDAGARFVGKTQTEELAFSMIGQNVHFPHPVNPRAPDRVTGGSSSGSAAAVAGGLADIAIGSDTGGSIRAPASFCGLVGLAHHAWPHPARRRHAAGAVARHVRLVRQGYRHLRSGGEGRAWRPTGTARQLTRAAARSQALDALVCRAGGGRRARAAGRGWSADVDRRADSRCEPVQAVTSTSSTGACARSRPRKPGRCMANGSAAGGPRSRSGGGGALPLRRDRLAARSARRRRAAQGVSHRAARPARRRRLSGPADGAGRRAEERQHARRIRRASASARCGCSAGPACPASRR